MSNTENIKTEKDYKKTGSRLGFAVLTKENIVMSGGFISKEEAEDFRDNAYCGYYKDCEIKMIKVL